MIGVAALPGPSEWFGQMAERAGDRKEHACMATGKRKRLSSNDVVGAVGGRGGCVVSSRVESGLVINVGSVDGDVCVWLLILLCTKFLRNCNNWVCFSECFVLNVSYQ